MRASSLFKISLINLYYTMNKNLFMLATQVKNKLSEETIHQMNNPDLILQKHTIFGKICVML